MSLAPEDDDPLSLHPPILETLEERNTRLAIEKRAKDISDDIDAELERARAVERRSPKPIKILLLGQSESGKSTTLKNFQLMYDPKSFRAERASWRGVIQLNVVQSIRAILEAMDRATRHDHDNSAVPQSPKKGLPPLTPELLTIKVRLAPLLGVEKNLVRRLTGGATPSEASPRHGPVDKQSNPDPPKQGLKEVAINSAIPWKVAFNRLIKSEATRDSFDSAEGIDWDDPDDPWQLLHDLAPDMKFLWNSANIKQLLVKQKVKAEDLNGYFLDSLDRITAPRYIPTDDDILRARLKTLGASEHRFKIATSGSLRDWKVYDVGGHRSQRAAWAPYFDDMDAIIFLAPISGFDQVLEEDHRVNRLEDSFKLWTMIVSNQLLKDTNLILFLNKIDILRNKLTAGIQLKDYVVSYSDRPNDVENTTAYLKRKFGGILNECSPSPRVFYCHLTTVTDTKSTKYILSNLKDMLMRQNLLKTNLIT